MECTRASVRDNVLGFHSTCRLSLFNKIAFDNIASLCTVAFESNHGEHFQTISSYHKAQDAIGNTPPSAESRIRHTKARVPDNDTFTGVLKPGNCVVDPAACVDNKHFSFVRVHYVAF